MGNMLVILYYLLKILEVLLLKIPITNGGKLIAIPVDKRLKIIVSNISFKKSNNPKSELDLKRELTELKFSKLLYLIFYYQFRPFIMFFI